MGKPDAVYKNLCKNDGLRRFIAIKLICAISLAYGLEPLLHFGAWIRLVFITSLIG
jgi:hypothetical protein